MFKSFQSKEVSSDQNLTLDGLDKLDYIFKIVLIGDTGVGKSNMLSKFSRNDFNLESKPTIGVEFASRIIIQENTNEIIKAEVWDTAGQEKFKSLVKQYYRNSLGVMLCFDLTDRHTFEDISNWISEIQLYCDLNVKICLVGNKCDLEQLRQVSKSEAFKLAESKKYMYYETSGLNGTNIEIAFLGLIDQIYQMCKDPNMVVELPNKDPQFQLYNNNAEQLMKQSQTCCQQKQYQFYK